jgi:hypothetical protein
MAAINDLEHNTALAFAARRYIRRELRKGRDYVTYGDLMKKLSIDRFKLGHVLGVLQWVDTRIDSPLYSVYVSYKNGDDKGKPGESFYSCARELGYEFEDNDAFMKKMRRRIKKRLGLL